MLRLGAGSYRPNRLVVRKAACWSRGLAILGIGLAACTGDTAASPRPPAPLPPGAQSLSVQTAPPESVVPTDWACAEALLPPLRVVRVGSAVVFENLEGDEVDLVLPRGFSARLVDGTAEIADPTGAVFAKEGDILAEVLAGDVSEVCWVDGVYYPPAA